jgi:hypothetical protein
MKFLVLLLLTGCGLDATECQLGLFRVHGDFKFTCSKFETNFELAKKMLVEYDIVPNTDMFVIGDINLLHQDEFIPSNPVTRATTGNEDLWGLFEPPNQITLNKTDQALLHEMCHYYDEMLFQNIGDNHTGWMLTTGKNKNRYLADNLYTNLIIPIE